MILLLRHGETEFNREKRFQGHMDSPLTELGERQARAMGRLIRDLIRGDGGWRLVSSPLGRAHRTAQLLAAATGLSEIEAEPRLIEITVGQWDGRLRSEAEAEAGPMFARSGWDFSSPPMASLSKPPLRAQHHGSIAFRRNLNVASSPSAMA